MPASRALKDGAPKESAPLQTEGSTAPTLTKEQHELISSLPSLVQLLQCNPAQQSPSHAAKEAKVLDQLALSFASVYDFTSSSSPTAEAFVLAFNTLVAKRLVLSEWRARLREDHLLRVLQSIRLLTRDVQLRRALVDAGAVQELCGVFLQQTTLHFDAQITPLQVELLTELASIAKRLAADDWGLAAMVACNMQQVLVQLLASTDPAVLPLVMVALIGFAAHREHAVLVSGATVLHLLLRIVAEYDTPFKRLAADLLALLSRRETVVSELLELNGLGRIVGQLSAGDPPLTASLLRVVCYMASDSRALGEFYQTGAIPVLLSLVAAALKESGGPGGTGLTANRITDLQLVCTALTRVSEDDELAGAIRTANGVALLGRLLLLTSAPAADPQESDRLAKELSMMLAYVLRALRFLFSMERNRKVFKRLFPPDIFAAFIDVGHYNAQLAMYTNLVQRIEDLNEKGRAALAAALDDICADRDGPGAAAEPLRTVRGGSGVYILLEMLGKGAYGAVYKARRARGDALVALKEVPLSDVGLFGVTAAEREKGVGQMGKEVDILSSMSHPHIVQYYESFVEGPHLYIAMELVEGVSLLDHINSLAEKGRRMSEQDVWQVILPVTLALHYIHSVAKVVHRDLTPANIMLGPGPDGLRHAKIADFGLAKRLSGGAITAQSVVGTMPYTCPEIIQQEQYSEKADVWSLGCVLYHCMTLRPPFDGTNPLSVASKIVEGTYEPASDPPEGPAYSLHLKQLQRLLMTVDPSKRPSMEEVGALVSGQLMAALEKLTASEQRLQRALTVERAHHRRGASAGMMLGGLDIPSSPMAPAFSSPFATPNQNSPNPSLWGPNTTSNANRQVSHLCQHGALESPMRPGAMQCGAAANAAPGSPFAVANLRARRQLLEPLSATAGAQGGNASGGGANAISSPSAVPIPAQAAAGPNTPTDATAGEHAGGDKGMVGVSAWDGSGPMGPASAVGPGAATTPATPGRVVSLATSRLRPMQDPLTQMLAQLHKIMWIEQLPPGLVRDARRRCVDVFRRALFGTGTNPVTLKAHLAKLQVGDTDVIRDAAGRPIVFGCMPVGNATQCTDGYLTYEQLCQVVEGLLHEKGYAFCPSQTMTAAMHPSTANNMHTMASGGHNLPAGNGGADATATSAPATSPETLAEQLPPSVFNAGPSPATLPVAALPAANHHKDSNPTPAVSGLTDNRHSGIDPIAATGLIATAGQSGSPANATAPEVVRVGRPSATNFGGVGAGAGPVATTTAARAGSPGAAATAGALTMPRIASRHSGHKQA